MIDVLKPRYMRVVHGRCLLWTMMVAPVWCRMTIWCLTRAIQEGQAWRPLSDMQSQRLTGLVNTWCRLSHVHKLWPMRQSTKVFPRRCHFSLDDMQRTQPMSPILMCLDDDLSCPPNKHKTWLILASLADVVFHWPTLIFRCAHATYVHADLYWSTMPLIDDSFKICTFHVRVYSPWLKFFAINKCLLPDAHMPRQMHAILA